MSFHDEYNSKRISMADAVTLVKDHTTITTLGIFAEPWGFLGALKELKGKASDVVISTMLPSKPYDYLSDSEYEGIITLEPSFASRFCPSLQKIGRSSYVPCHMRTAGYDLLEGRKHAERRFQIYCITVSPMDRHGYFTTGPCAVYNRQLLREADLVIVEVNEKTPRTFGDTCIHISEVDYITEYTRDMFALDSSNMVSETEAKIGKYIADLVDDGSTIQLGIGNIPNAVANELMDKKDLGLHTEMISDGVMKLCKSGVINNRKKTYYEGKMITTFSYGSQELYDFLDENPAVLHLDACKTNDPYLISQNNNMISVNTALQVDLVGQCASEAIGTLQISGTGGQTDTALGARMAPNGKSIIALKSTANIKDGKGGVKRVSAIQAVHPAGTMISLTRQDVDCIVTEYGVAHLRGTSIRERAKKLISIAHPDFREELLETAKQYHII